MCYFNLLISCTPSIDRCALYIHYFPAIVWFSVYLPKPSKANAWIKGHFSRTNGSKGGSLSPGLGSVNTKQIKPQNSKINVVTNFLVLPVFPLPWACHRALVVVEEERPLIPQVGGWAWSQSPNPLKIRLIRLAGRQLLIQWRGLATQSIEND